MKKNLNAVFVERVKAPTSGRVTYWDQKTRGLGLRLSEGGRKSWVLYYRRQGQQRWLQLGTYPPLSLADARELAKDKLADVQKGGDPSSERRDARAAGTFAHLTERYLTEYAARNKKLSSIKEDTRNIKRELVPSWGPRRANDIVRKDVVALINRIAARPAPIHANRILALVSKIFNFGISQEIVEINPAHQVERPVKKEHARERVLSPVELKNVWGVIEDESEPTRSIFKLLLLTGQRRTEVREMRWSEVDLESASWTIPSERAKNKETHMVPLVGESLEILKTLSALRKKDSADNVFVGRFGTKPFAGLQKGLERIVEKSKVDFRVHDLRRTVGTGLGAMDIDRTTIKKLFNHSERGDVTAIYDRHRYDSQKSAALLKWDRRLHEVVTGKSAEPAKMVALRA